MSGKSEFWELVDEGRAGHNIGLSIGSPKLEAYMDGYLPGTSYLIGGISGSSKSTFTLEKFVYHPLMDYLAGNSVERDPYWILFSLEMTRPQVYAKLISHYIYDTFGETIRFKDMFSRGKDCMLTDEMYSLMRNEEIDKFIDILDERLYFHEGTLNESVYLSVLNTQLQRFGEFTADKKFVPKNPHQVVGVIVDHMSLVKASPGKSKKDEMDAISRDSVLLRNTTKIVSPIHVAQFNRNSTSDERLKQNMQSPGSEDFKDSAALYEDSSVVIALFSPHSYKMSTYQKYNIKVLEQSFIVAFLLKSRFGTSNVAVPLGFYGDCSKYLELPKPEDMIDVERYRTPDWVNEEQVKQVENNFNIVF